MALDTQYQPARTPFDFTRYSAPYEVDRVKILKELIPPGDGKRAIDIGCAPGFFSRELSEKGWRTTSIDSDKSNLEKAKVYAHEIHQGDAASVLSKMPEDHFDLVLSLEIIEHMPKTQGENLLAQIMRVLKTGGTLIVSTPNRLSPEGVGDYYWGEKIRRCGTWTAWEPTHVHIYTSSEILRLLRATGFVVDTTIGYYYEGDLPVIGHWRLPWVKSSVFPSNRLGFNIILKCHKKLLIRICEKMVAIAHVRTFNIFPPARGETCPAEFIRLASRDRLLVLGPWAISKLQGYFRTSGLVDPDTTLLRQFRLDHKRGFC